MNNVLATKERIKSIDNISGFMIIIMVLGHYTSITWYDPFSGILDYFNFFMPWFFWKSGMFYKIKENKHQLLYSAKKLLYPFVTFSLIGHLTGIINLYISGDRNIIHYTITPLKEILLSGSLNGNPPLWFLLSLFASQSLFNLLFNKKIPTYAIALISITLSIILHYLYIPRPLYLHNIFTGLFFYSVGYLLKNIQYKKEAFFISAFILFFIVLFELPIVSMRFDSVAKGNYLLWFLYSTSSCILVDSFFTKVNSNILTRIGKNSLSIFLTHWLIAAIASIYVRFVLVDFSNISFFYISTTALIIVEPILIFLINKTKLSSLIYYPS